MVVIGQLPYLASVAFSEGGRGEVQMGQLGGGYLLEADLNFVRDRHFPGFNE